MAMHYHFRLAGSPLDVSNHAYMLMMVENRLVAADVLPGDDQRYVASITTDGEEDGGGPGFLGT